MAVSCNPLVTAPWKRPVELFAQLYIHGSNPPELHVFAQLAMDPPSQIICTILQGSCLLNCLQNSSWIHPLKLFEQLCMDPSSSLMCTTPAWIQPHEFFAQSCMNHPTKLFAQLCMDPFLQIISTNGLILWNYLYNLAWIHPPRIFAKSCIDPPSQIICTTLHEPTSQIICTNPPSKNSLHNSVWIHLPELHIGANLHGSTLPKYLCNFASHR
jgi:hypothetical protein